MKLQYKSFSIAMLEDPNPPPKKKNIQSPRVEKHWKTTNVVFAAPGQQTAIHMRRLDERWIFQVGFRNVIVPWD